MSMGETYDHYTFPRILLKVVRKAFQADYTVRKLDKEGLLVA